MSVKVPQYAIPVTSGQSDIKSYKNFQTNSLVLLSCTEIGVKVL